MNKDNIILGIESSCDDTSAAIIKNGKLLTNIVAGQAVHKKYGGVVPELASRAHQQNIVPVVDTALKEAGVTLDQLSAIAFTKGPGLLGSLLVGTSFAKSMSLALDIPLVEVNHMKGHVLAHFVDTQNNTFNPPKFPFICLTVSGGHTQLLIIRDYLDMEVVGETIDDAAGEAFDKAAKLLELPYPGGPLIDKYGKEGNEKAFSFTTPKKDGYNYSFSGLKTQFLYFLQKHKQENPKFVEENLEDICASYQNHIVNYLLKNLKQLIADTGIKEIALAGGVSANSKLRSELVRLGEKHHWNVHIPEFQLTTDNAAMIAITGYYHFLKGEFSDLSVAPSARMKI